MRTLAMLATLLLGLAVVFWAPATKAHCPHGGDATHEHCGGGAPATSNEFRFIGFTDETFNGEPDTIVGGQGMLAMHALCQDDFGPNARAVMNQGEAAMYRMPLALAFVIAAGLTVSATSAQTDIGKVFEFNVDGV